MYRLAGANIHAGGIFLLLCLAITAWDNVHVV